MNNLKNSLRFKFLFCILAISFLPSSNALADSLSITAPLADTEVIEGDDFASIELENPWDFNERRDIGWEEGYNGPTVSVSGGVWSGINAASGAYVFPLFQGFREGLKPDVLPGDRSLPALGYNNPINAAKYTLLSYRVNHNSRSSYFIYWNNDPNLPGGWPNGSNLAGQYDGYYHGAGAFAREPWEVYSFDMSANGGQFAAYSGSWSGSIISLRLDPSIVGAVGSQAQYDWVRLVDPTSAPNHTITWSTTGVNQSNAVITIYVDTNNSGFDGTPIKRFTNGSNPGSWTFPTAMLPPGDYYFYVSGHVAGDPSSQYARSEYTPRLRVSKAPEVVFSAPSMVSGDDYATTELGDPWDMDQTTDLPNLDLSWPTQWRQFSSESFNAGIFQAVANSPLSGSLHTDVQTHFRIPLDKPIDTSKYRYVSYRLAVDDSQFPTISDKVRDGWVGRVVWWTGDEEDPRHFSSFWNSVGHTDDHPIYEGWHTYVFDLHDPLTHEYNKKFTDNPWLYHLRFDPLETVLPTWFYLDYFRLTADPRPDSSGNIDLEFSVADSDSATVDVSLYYDLDNVGYNGTLITTLSGIAPGNHSHVWNMSSIAANTAVYVYAVVSDGTNTRRAYASVPILGGQYQTKTPPAIPRDIAISNLVISPKSVSKKGKRVTVSVDVSDNNPLTSVNLFVERKPSKWRKTVPMTLVPGTTNRYTARVSIPKNKTRKKQRYYLYVQARSSGPSVIGGQATAEEYKSLRASFVSQSK
ncbi:hypothetical protein JNK13_03465 [bacterium]|nr:hypothetical protein [bacterium]